MPWWCYAPISTCFKYHMATCLCALMHICLESFIIIRSDAYMLLCSQVLTCLACNMCTWKIVYSHAHSWMLTCLIAHMLEMLTCLNAHMLSCFDDHILPSSHALLIICYYVACLKITCLDAHIHWYSHIWFPHTSAHTWLMICLYSWRLKWSCSYTFVRLNALTIVLEC